MSVKAKVAKLEQKARADGKFAVAATAVDLLSNLDCMDRQINLVGAMHGMGYLQNSLAPYWKEFRTDEAAWSQRCLERLLDADRDDWAVAALLGCQGAAVIALAKALGFSAVETRDCSRYDKPDVRFETLFKRNQGRVLCPLIEIGFDVKSGVVVDVVRARALSLDDEEWQVGQPIGQGSLTYFMRASLPHGTWRMVQTEFEPNDDKPESDDA